MKKHNRVAFHFCLIIMIVLLCVISVTAVSNSIRVKDMFEKHSMVIYVGDTVKIGDLYEDNCDFYYNEDYYIFSSTSSDATIAKATGSYGCLSIEAVSEGVVTIRAYGSYYDYYTGDNYDSCYDEILVTVKTVPSSKIKVGSIPDKTYTGKAIKPTVSLSFGTTKLKKDTDYSVSYKNNTAVGKATISIKLKGRYDGTITKTFNIIPAINKTKATVYLKNQLILTAKSSKSITWKSSNNSIAKVSNKGVITPIKAGTVKITATSNGVSATCTVTVKKQSLNSAKKTIYVGETYSLKYYGGTDSIKWKSSNTNIASVSRKGVVKGVKAGTAVISATRNNVKRTCKITVINQRISKSSVSMQIGDTIALHIVGAVNTVTWQTSNNSIASVSAKGLVTAKKAGSTTIIGKHNGKNFKCSVTVEKTSYGTVSGNVTYLYNYYRGNVPDTNSVVILVSTSGSAKKMPNFETYIDWSLPSVINNYNSYGVYATKVDGMGQYKFNRVKTGSYKIFIISSETTSGAAFNNLDKYSSDCASIMKNYVSLTNANYLGECVGHQKYDSKTITVTENQDYFYSHDFGITYI